MLIRANCPTCGDVPLNENELHLYTDGTYAFNCPDCRDLVEKIAGERVIRLLASVGIHPKERNALTIDDLLNFMADISLIDTLAEYA